MLLFTAFLIASVVAQNTATFEELAARAAAARQADDVPQALQLYRQSVNLNPKWEEGWWFLGSMLYDSDRYAEGGDALQHVVALDPKAAPAWALLGLCEFETGDYAHSLDHIQRGLAPGSPSPQMEEVLRYHEALLLTHSGRFSEAIEKYTWFARKGVQNPDLLVGIGLAVLQSPKFPNDVRSEQERYAIAGSAAFLNMNGDFRNAQMTYRKLVEQYPEAPYVHYAYGCFLLGTNPEAGIQELRRELAINPASAPANAMLAFALLERGDAAAALTPAKAAADEQPNSELSQYVLGRALAEQGNLGSGIQHLEIAEKIDPADLQPHISLATAYSRAGRPQDSRRERIRAVAIATGASPIR
ncbi:MAG TPA: tetratricopeptide repeat protein [Bryobacteraceae bacterium]|nr:tetratricopeptide repeat protein [Bryobacteraceae bacterium]